MDILTEIGSLFPGDTGHIVGFGCCLNLLNEKYAEYDYCLSIGLELDRSIIESIRNGPTPEYCALYGNINSQLTETAEAIAGLLSSRGIKALPIPPTVMDSDIDEDQSKRLRLDFSHKMTATLAGIGWIGKTDLLISRRFGPRVRLASVLVDSEIAPPAKPVTESSCGSCRLCITACPAQAANGKSWNRNVDRDEFYDAFKCRDMCRQITGKNLGYETTICGICISVCPVGKE